MAFIEIGGARFELNEGYLVDFQEWSQNVAAMLAKTAEGASKVAGLSKPDGCV